MYNLNIDQKHKLKNEVYNSKSLKWKCFPVNKFSVQPLLSHRSIILNKDTKYFLLSAIFVILAVPLKLSALMKGI